MRDQAPDKMRAGSAHQHSACSAFHAVPSAVTRLPISTRPDASRPALQNCVVFDNEEENKFIYTDMHIMFQEKVAVAV